MNRETIERLASEKSDPCVTITLNTHRTKPDNRKDSVLLKNLCNEAKKRIIAEFGKRPVSKLLSKLEKVTEEIDMSLNLDSLHIFLSNETKEIIKSTWPAQADMVHISNRFAIRPLIFALNRTDEYLILLLSQSGVKLFSAINDIITEEITNESFPFSENVHFHTDPQRKSDPRAVDNMVREFLNKVDKAVVKIHNQTGLQCIVICTADNYNRLMQVADRNELYPGHANINYNNTANHFISAQAWEIVKEIQYDRRLEAIREIKEAVSQGKVITDLKEIYRAAKEGRGDLLITSYDYFQAVRMKDELSFDLVQDVTFRGVVDDITGIIAWEVISKNGRALFVKADYLKDLGNIVLKVRY